MSESSQISARIGAGQVAGCVRLTRVDAWVCGHNQPECEGELDASVDAYKHTELREVLAVEALKVENGGRRAVRVGGCGWVGGCGGPAAPERLSSALQDRDAQMHKCTMQERNYLPMHR
jgi:hypothetical protein